MWVAAASCPCAEKSSSDYIKLLLNILNLVSVLCITSWGGKIGERKKKLRGFCVTSVAVEIPQPLRSTECFFLGSSTPRVPPDLLFFPGAVWETCVEVRVQEPGLYIAGEVCALGDCSSWVVRVLCLGLLFLIYGSTVAVESRSRSRPSGWYWACRWPGVMQVSFICSALQCSRLWRAS